MKPLTTFLIVALSCSFALVSTPTFAQDVGDDDASVASDQLESTILKLRKELMKLESERSDPVVPVDIVSSQSAGSSTRSAVGSSTRNAVGSSTRNSVRSGGDIFSNSQVVDTVPAQLPTSSYSVGVAQQSLPYYPQALPTTLPADSSWLGQPVQTQPLIIPAPAQPVYAAPAVEFAQPAPIVQQPPVIVQQAPAPQVPQTIIYNIYQQAPAAAPNNFFPSIMAPIYGPPIQFSAPRRGCCLFGRR